MCRRPTTRCSTSWWTPQRGAWYRAAIAKRCETASAAPSTTGVMKRVARQFAERTVSPRLSPGLNGLPLQDEIVRVAAAFVDLQQHRHEADYDVGRRFTRLKVLNIVSDAERAFVDWRAVRKVALRPPSGLSASWREAGWGLADAALVDSASIMRRRSWEAAIPGS